jgi:intracellular multiplication protein IcmK
VRRPFTLKTLCLVSAVVALSSPALAQQSPERAGNAATPSARNDVVESAIPLTPGMIRDLGRRIGDNKRAEEEVNTEIASPLSRRVNVSFAPGESTPIVRIVKGYPTALSFFDRTGQPWPIEWDTNSNPAGSNGNCNQGPAGGGGPAVASAGFYVCTPVAGSNVLQVAAGSLQPRGGLLVTLKGAPKPISFMLVAGGGRYDADLTVQVAERGPNAKGPASGPVAPDTASPFLTAMLDGAPPAEAVPLAVAGVSPDDLRAWKVGDRVVLRTRFALISPEWLASETGEGGVTVYSLPVTPIVLLSEDGRTISASLSEP